MLRVHLTITPEERQQSPGRALAFGRVAGHRLGSVTHANHPTSLDVAATECHSVGSLMVLVPGPPQQPCARDRPAPRALAVRAQWPTDLAAARAAA